MRLSFRIMPLLALGGCASVITRSAEKNQAPALGESPRIPFYEIPEERVQELERLLKASDPGPGIDALLMEIQKVPKQQVPEWIQKELQIHRQVVIDYFAAVGREAIEKVGEKLPAHLQLLLSQNGEIYFNYLMVGNERPFKDLPSPLQKLFIENKETILTYLVLNPNHPFSAEFLLNFSLQVGHQYWKREPTPLWQEEYQSLFRAVARRWGKEGRCFIPEDYPAFQVTPVRWLTPDLIEAGLNGGGCTGKQIEQILVGFPYAGVQIGYGILMGAVRLKERWPQTPDFRLLFIGVVEEAGIDAPQFNDAVRGIFEESVDREIAQDAPEIVPDFWAAVLSFRWLVTHIPMEKRRAFIEEAIDSKPNYALALLAAAAPEIKKMPAGVQVIFAMRRQELERLDQLESPRGSRKRLAEIYLEQTTYDE